MSGMLRAVKGMNDLFPPQSQQWQWFENQVHAVMARNAYGAIRTPIVEPTALFVRGLGEVTDIVEKEMYSFEDAMNQDRLTLRPEGTAGVVRAVVEHNVLYNGPKRLYYIGPMFRHERPQKGRYRQFHQVGIEALGFPGPELDAEVILLAAQLWDTLGLDRDKHLTLEINCLGQVDERRAHREALIAHLQAHESALDEDARRRLHSNPLRILDTKNPALQAVVEAAPRLMDYLGAASRAHFDTVCAALDAAGQTYRINPRLVRGMDYYNLTVFEWVTPHLGSQATVCAGGRYDGLVAQLGGKPAPGVGFGLGIERLMLLLEALALLPPVQAPTVYAIVPDEALFPAVQALLHRLRRAGVSVQMHGRGPDGVGSMKAQFKKADASGAAYALIFGAQEWAQAQVALKPLREGLGAQEILALDDWAQWAQRLRTA